MYICEILAVGTELLLGDIVNSNAQYLSRQLAQMGIAVKRHSTVGDNPDRLRQALQEALARSDLLITTGGLGPTQDDITKEICCELLQEPLIFHEASYANIVRRFQQRGQAMPNNNRKQAYVPETGHVFANENGTAPGIAIEKNGKCIILLPGPPREMQPMFQTCARPFLQKFAQGVIVSQVVRTMGIGESAMAGQLADLLQGENPSVSPYAGNGEAWLRVTAKGQTQQEAQAMCQPLVAEIRARLGTLVYGVDVANIEARVVALLAQKQQQLATAESCTGGLLAKRITDIPGASAVFAYGAVTYSNAAKQALLGVQAQSLAQYSAVSAQVACEMAAGIRQKSGADYGLATTGYAGPGSGAGISYIALASAQGVHSACIQTGHPQDRELNRIITASRALNLLRLELEQL